ncbi:MAG: M20/M25/M40 family metallo-hydrolase [Alphaproteobacteria bacterium]|nr:M20/M25/M40 family metallo-hydrolase [Alphaproteobacteria bacterium]
MKHPRDEFEEVVRGSRERLVELCRSLVRIGSENPPGDTGELALFIEGLFANAAATVTRRIVGRAPATNLVVCSSGEGPGRRLVFNGHLDTFPVGDARRWSMPPLGGILSDRRIYGRGAADMKAGLAAAILSALLLADCRGAWRGELVLALAADEETGGLWGTQHLLANVPEARGDAMVSGDAGAPQVVRIGEKGQLWLEIVAEGRAGHGAHVHLGENAIERLIGALDRIRQLRDLPCSIPEDVRNVIRAAKPISEPVSGEGEAETLQAVTVNIGRIEGGSAVNIIPDLAQALVDIRFPPGVTVAQTRGAIDRLLGDLSGVRHRILSCCEATVTDPASEIVQLSAKNARVATGGAAVLNMRVGFSDARFYRLAAIPSVVYGPTPHNMGGIDEYVTVDDLFAVFYVHAMTAYDFLRREDPPSSRANRDQPRHREGS